MQHKKAGFVCRQIIGLLPKTERESYASKADGLFRIGGLKANGWNDIIRKQLDHYRPIVPTECPLLHLKMH